MLNTIKTTLAKHSIIHAQAKEDKALPQGEILLSYETDQIQRLADWYICSPAKIAIPCLVSFSNFEALYCYDDTKGTISLD